MKITFLLHFYSRIRKERERKISNEKEDRKKERKIFMSVITKPSLPSTLRYYEFFPSLHPTSPTTQDKPNSISPLCDVGEGEGIVASSGRSCKEREVGREKWNWVWGTGGCRWHKRVYERQRRRKWWWPRWVVYCESSQKVYMRWNPWLNVKNEIWISLHYLVRTQYWGGYWAALAKHK